MPLQLECAPAFNYARSPHKTEIVQDGSIAQTVDEASATVHMKALFQSTEAKLNLDLRYVPESSLDNVPEPKIELELLDLTKKGHLGPSVSCEFELREGQAVTFVLRTPPDHAYPDAVKPSEEKAERLGVGFESAFRLVALFGVICSISLLSRADLYCLHAPRPRRSDTHKGTPYPISEIMSSAQTAPSTSCVSCLT